MQRYYAQTDKDSENLDQQEIEIPTELIRPGLGPALQRVNAFLGGQLRIYICTKGRRGQVHACKLPTLDRYFAAHGLQICRPVFCTSDSDSMDDMSCCLATGKKLLRSCLTRALSMEQTDVELIYRENFLLVDDTADVADDMSKVVACARFRDPTGQRDDDFWPRFAADFEARLEFHKSIQIPNLANCSQSTDTMSSFMALEQNEEES